MQLFGLINVLLENDQLTSRSNLRITRYAVMPLSSNSGIIGWVKNCDTMHQVRVWRFHFCRPPPSRRIDQKVIHATDSHSYRD